MKFPQCLSNHQSNHFPLSIRIFSSLSSICSSKTTLWWTTPATPTTSSWPPPPSFARARSYPWTSSWRGRGYYQRPQRWVSHFRSCNFLFSLQVNSVILLLLHSVEIAKIYSHHFSAKNYLREINVFSAKLRYKLFSRNFSKRGKFLVFPHCVLPQWKWHIISNSDYEARLSKADQNEPTNPAIERATNALKFVAQHVKNEDSFNSVSDIYIFIEHSTQCGKTRNSLS